MSKPSTAEAHKPNLDYLKNLDTWYNNIMYDWCGSVLYILLFPVSIVQKDTCHVMHVWCLWKAFSMYLLFIIIFFSAAYAYSFFDWFTTCFHHLAWHVLHNLRQHVSIQIPNKWYSFWSCYELAGSWDPHKYIQYWENKLGL